MKRPKPPKPLHPAKPAPEPCATLALVVDMYGPLGSALDVMRTLIGDADAYKHAAVSGHIKIHQAGTIEVRDFTEVVGRAFLDGEESSTIADEKA